MLAQLPTELVQKIAIYASPLIDLAVAPVTPSNSKQASQLQSQPVINKPVISFDVSPPTVVTNLSETCQSLNKCLRLTSDNAFLWAKVFERTFDFDAPRRRLGLEWASAHGLAWEGRRRWKMIKRIRRAVTIWENNDYRGYHWLDEYGEEDITRDLWTLYFMLLENDGKNAVLLIQRAKLISLLEMLCGLHFGRRLARRVGWPHNTHERALLAWILYVVDPMPGDFSDQEVYFKTKISMRAFILGCFKYPICTLPPTSFHHPSQLDASTYQGQQLPTELLPVPLNPLSSKDFAAPAAPLQTPLFSSALSSPCCEPLVPVMIYARMTYFYPPSLAVAALLWYFRGTQAQDASTATGSSNTSTGSPCEDQEIYSPLDNERMEHIATRVGRRNNTGASGHKNGDTTPSSSSSASTTSPTQFNYPPWPSTNLNRASSLGTTQSRSFHSTTSSTYQAAGADMYGWSSPIIFSIPVETDTPSIPPSMTASLSQSQCAPGTSGHPAVPSKPQYELTRGYRNRLWRRGFNNASRQLEQEWARRVEGKMRFEGPGGGTTAPRGFIPGSLEGVWEGGFLYLDFPEYGAFLTGEEEPDAEFYQKPSNKLYRHNKQIWRLKEYEFHDPSSTFGVNGVSKGAPDSNIAGSPTSPVATSRGNPLSIGKWKQGWLPNPESLAWTFPDEGETEGLKIIETVIVEGPRFQAQARRRSTAPLDSQVNSPSDSQVINKPRINVDNSYDSNLASDGRVEDKAQVLSYTAGTDNTVNGRGDSDGDGDWTNEQAVVTGKMRGRRTRPKSASVAQSPTTAETGLYPALAAAKAAARERAASASLATPVSPLSPPPASAPPTSAPYASFMTSSGQTEKDLPKVPLTPPAPSLAKPFVGEGRTFSWNWGRKNKDKEKDKKSKDKDKDKGKGKSRSKTKSPPPPIIGHRLSRVLVDDDEEAEFYGGDVYTHPTSLVRSPPLIPPLAEESERGKEQEQQEDQEAELGQEAKAQENWEPLIEERVAHYVHWDPDVAWAKDAIWGKSNITASSSRGSKGSKESGVVKGRYSYSNPSGIPNQPGDRRATIDTNGSGSASGAAGLPKSVPPVAAASAKGPSGAKPQRVITDILVFGESHSSWGEASIRGRIRLHDGLITLVKTYPQRATWIYTGYVVGGESFVGRWRDASSPEEINGYEGPFAMKRRR